MLPNRHAFKALTQTYIINSRWYYTRRNQKNKASLYGIISPLGNPKVNVTPELEKWVEMGNIVRFEELRRIIIDLRKRKRSTQALQVSEWMKSKGIYTLTPGQHAVHLDLIGRIYGFRQAESYFNSLSEQDKTLKTYGALLHCYVRQRQTERALTHVKNMKEKGLALSSVALNDIMCLYFNIGANEKVPEVFEQMKQNGVEPDNLSYKICINSFGVRSDIKGLERVLNEMESNTNIVMDWNIYSIVANFYIKADLKYKANCVLKKAEERLDNKDGLGYNHLISLHAQLGNRDDVLRLWSLEKNACKRCLNRDYTNVMVSLVKLDEFEKAEEVIKEWESSGNFYDFRVPSAIIIGFIEKGLCEKARALLEHLMEMSKESTSTIWGRLATGYLNKGEMESALESLRVALSLPHESKELEDKVISEVLRLVGERGSTNDAEKVVNLLRSAMPLKREMYHTSLRSLVTGGKEVDGLLDIMKSDHYEEDEETLKILSFEQTFESSG